MMRDTESAAPIKSRSRRKALIITVVVVGMLVVLFAVSEIVIPRVASAYVKREIEKRYPDTGSISVSLKAFPAIRLLFKDYSELEVEAEDIRLQDVNFDAIELKSNNWPDATVTATIGQDEINRFFSLKHSYVKDPMVVLEQDIIRVTGSVYTDYATAGVTATGDLEPLGGKQVYFTPRSIDVAGVPVPGKGVETVRRIMDETPIFVVRPDLPYSISAITVEDGMLKIEGNVDLEKALDIKL